MPELELNVGVAETLVRLFEAEDMGLVEGLGSGESWRVTDAGEQYLREQGFEAELAHELALGGGPGVLAALLDGADPKAVRDWAARELPDWKRELPRWKS